MPAGGEGAVGWVWTQTGETVCVVIELPGRVDAGAVSAAFTPHTVCVSVRGLATPPLSGATHQEVLAPQCRAEVRASAAGSVLAVTLAKAVPIRWLFPLRGAAGGAPLDPQSELELARHHEVPGAAGRGGVRC